MRNILFRAHRQFPHKGWVYGVPIDYLHTLMVEEDYSVWPESDTPSFTHAAKIVSHTLGQYIGIGDKHGNRIFGGDIVKARVKRFAFRQTYYETNVYRVEYHPDYCFFHLTRKKDELLFHDRWNYRLEELEVIGNIYDNPELMEETMWND